MCRLSYLRWQENAKIHWRLRCGTCMPQLPDLPPEHTMYITNCKSHGGVVCMPGSMYVFLVFFFMYV